MRARACSSPRSGGTRQSTRRRARAGMTLTFFDASIIVGVIVTPSVGSTSSAMRGSRRSRSSNAASTSPSTSMPSARRNASGSAVSSSAGRPPRSASRIGAIFDQRVVADARDRRVPGRAVGEDREAEDALLGDAAEVDLPALELERVAAALVDDVVAAHLVGVLARRATAAPIDPPASSSAVKISLSSPDSGRQPSSASSSAAAASAATCDFMSSAPRPQTQPSRDLAGPGVDRPVVGVGEHGVDVPHVAERRPVGRPAQPRDQVGPPLDRREELALEPGVLQQAAQPLLAPPARCRAD